LSEVWLINLLWQFDSRSSKELPTFQANSQLCGVCRNGCRNMFEIVKTYIFPTVLCTWVDFVCNLIHRQRWSNVVNRTINSINLGTVYNILANWENYGLLINHKRWELRAIISLDDGTIHGWFATTEQRSKPNNKFNKLGDGL
jgi:hypothetical protein